MLNKILLFSQWERAQLVSGMSPIQNSHNSNLQNAHGLSARPTEADNGIIIEFKRMFLFSERSWVMMIINTIAYIPHSAHPPPMFRMQKKNMKSIS